MRVPLVLAALLMATVLSGCTASKEGFTAKQDGSTFSFHSNAVADEYTWDFGDRSALAHGRDATHTYAFADGTLNVKLTTKAAGVEKDTQQQITLGTGKNQSPTFILEAPTNWTVVGEAFRLSAAASSDPDHDPLLYSWSCLRVRDIQRMGVHSHPPPPGGAGVRFDTPPAGAVTARLSTKPLAAPTKVYSGDFCDSLGSASGFTQDATIEGTFAKTGFYTVTLLATDGKIPTTAGRWDVYVSNRAERPSPIIRVHFAGNLTAGLNGELAGAAGTALPNQTFDRAQIGFGLPLAASGANINFTFDAGASGLNKATWTLLRSEKTIAEGTESAHVGRLEAGPYTLVVTLNQGANVAFDLQVAAYLIMDPASIY